MLCAKVLQSHRFRLAGERGSFEREVKISRRKPTCSEPPSQEFKSFSDSKCRSKSKEPSNSDQNKHRPKIFSKQFPLLPKSVAQRPNVSSFQQKKMKSSSNIEALSSKNAGSVRASELANHFSELVTNAPTINVSSLFKTTIETS